MRRCDSETLDLGNGESELDKRNSTATQKSSSSSSSKPAMNMPMLHTPSPPPPSSPLSRPPHPSPRSAREQVKVEGKEDPKSNEEERSSKREEQKPDEKHPELEGAEHELGKTEQKPHKEEPNAAESNKGAPTQKIEESIEDIVEMSVIEHRSAQIFRNVLMKEAEKRQRQREHKVRKAGWGQVSKLKAEFSLSDQIDVGIKFFFSAKLSKLIRATLVEMLENAAGKYWNCMSTYP